jgi:O-antigen/teichoic acid export membrane protein
MSRLPLATSGTAMALYGQWGKLAVQLAGIAVLSRLLPHSAFGGYAMIMAIVGIAMLFGDFGLSLAAVRDKNITDEQASNLFWLNCAVAAAISSAVVGLAPLVAGLYGEPALVPAVRGLALVFLFGGCSAQHRSNLNRRLKFGQMAAADVVSQALGLAAAILFTSEDQSEMVLVVQQVVAALSALVILVVLSAWVPSPPSRSAGFGGAVRFGATASATQIVNYASSNVDYIAIGRVWGPDVLGVYSRAFQICALPLQQLASPLTRVVLPALAGKDPTGVRAYLRTAQLALTYVLLVCLGWLFGAADLVVWVLLGSGWDGAALYVRILAIGGVFQVLGYAYYWAFLAAGRMGVLLACEAVGRIVLVGLIVLAVGNGPELVAVAYATGLLVIWLITSVFGLRRIGLRASELARVGIRPALLAVVIAAVLGSSLRLASLLNVPMGAQLLLALVVPACVIGCGAAMAAPVRRDIAELRRVASGAESFERRS